MKSMAFEKVTSMAVNRLVVDQSDRRKFLVTSNSAFMTGVVTETSIHVDGAKTSNAFNGLIMIKMKGRKVYGIRMQKNQPMKFLVLDLDTLKEETFDLLTHTVDGLVVDIHHVGLRLFFVFTFGFRLCPMDGHGLIRAFTLPRVVTMRLAIPSMNHESFHSMLRLGFGQRRTSPFQWDVSFWSDTG